MNLKFKRVVLALVIVIGIIWNLLCLFEHIPFEKWNLSLVLVSVVCLFVFIPSLFPAVFPNNEKSKYIGELEKRERIYAVIIIGITIVWIVTIIICLMNL